MNNTYHKVPPEKHQELLELFLKQLDLYCPFCGKGFKQYKSNPEKEVYKCENCKSVIRNPKAWFDTVVQNYQGQIKVTGKDVTGSVKNVDKE
jgi:NAD-dependent SIR2 family protein deacetylase